MSERRTLRTILDGLLGIDLRALAVLRMALATILLYESVQYLRIGPAAASDSALSFLIEHNRLIIAPFALTLFLGFYTRTSNLLCWLIYLARVRHDLFTAHADLGNYVLLLFLFWSLFLPLGSLFSFDALRRERPEHHRYFSVATAATLCQLAIIYYLAGLTKNADEWLKQATALQTVLSGETFPTELGRWLAGYPTLLSLLSRLTIALEVAGPLLLFVPGPWNGRIRVVVVAAFIGFHIGLMVFMKLGIFPAVCIALWLIYLPSSFWDRLPLLGRRHASPDTTSPSQGTATLATTRIERSPIFNGLAGLAFAFVLLSNVLTLVAPKSDFAEPIQRVGKEICLYQLWQMFNTPSQGRRK